MLTSAMLVLVPPSSAPAGNLADQISRYDSNAGDAVRQIEPLLAPVGQVTSQLPADPQQAVIDRTAELSAALGFPQDPTLQFQTANLSDEVAGRLAIVIQDLIACNAVTQQHYSELRSRMEEVARTGGGLSSSQFADIDACAMSLWVSTTELELVLNAAPLCSPDFAAFETVVDVWPVLRLDGLCLNDLYENDYLLIVDGGGTDTYINNVGSNMVDLNFSPPGSPVLGLRGTGPAKGCQMAVAGLAAGDCVPATAVLLDMRGNDTFGVKQTPDVDIQCTNELVVRRMVTVGVGFLGVGILRDAGTSADKYTGKTVSVGAGHVFGVGILSDNGGHDTYSAVRNSQGFALVGGAGILRDEAGSDNYDFYMPLTTSMKPGGVFDDTGVCDKVPRFTLGAANVLPGTIGIFIDDAGGDTYHGAFAGAFDAPLQNPSTRAGSLGFGNNQGIAVFLDRGETSIGDTYVVDNEPACKGFPKRGNRRVIPPGITCTSDGGGAGIFIDQ